MALMLLITSLNAEAAVVIVLRSSGPAGSPSTGGSWSRLSATDRHGMPCSASKGVMLVSASGVQFHTCAIIGEYKWNCSYWSGVIARKHPPTNCQTRSIFAFPLGLCASVVDLLMPNSDCNVDIAVDKNSFAASEWKRRGIPFLTTMSYRSV